MIHEYDLQGCPEVNLNVRRLIQMYKAGEAIYTRRDTGAHRINLKDTTFSNFEYYYLLVSKEGNGQLWGKQRDSHTGIGVLYTQMGDQLSFSMNPANAGDIPIAEINEELPFQLLTGGRMVDGVFRRVAWRAFIYTPSLPLAAEHTRKRKQVSE